MRFEPLLACLALGASGLAQVPLQISPVAAARTMGNSGSNVPFAGKPSVYQQVHSLSSFVSRSPMLFTRMTFRMAEGFANTPGKTVDLEISMAACPHGYESADPVFARNVVSGSEVNVFARKMVNLPQVPDHRWAVGPLFFDTPFRFTGTGAMSWRTIVWGNSAGNNPFAYDLDGWAASYLGKNLGTYRGCTSSTGTSNAAHQAWMSLYATVDLWGVPYVPRTGLPSIAVIGRSDRNWSGIPLPFDLTPLGAPGCFVVNDVLLAFATATDQTGRALVSVPLPFDRSLEDAVFYSQYYFVEPAANPLGVFTSNGSIGRIPRQVDVAVVFAEGNPSATSGIVEGNRTLSVGLD